MSALQTPLVHPITGQPINPRTRYLRERRENLRRKLGGFCVRCGALEFLQFDCIVSCGPAHHEYSWRQRLRFYELQHAAGNLQLLCPRCHVVKTLDDIARRHLEGLTVGHPLSKGSPLGEGTNWLVPECFVVPIRVN